MTSETTAVDRSQLWFRRFAHRPHAGLRVYAFPFAGGSAAVYRPWTESLPASVELCAVQLPGRQDRIMEPAPADCAELVGVLADVLEPERTDIPFAFFGHSMGALLSFELTRELRRRGRPLPVALGLSGWPSPRDIPREGYADLTDEEFLRVLTRLGGMPDDVLNSPDLLHLVLPTLRADFRVVESHVYREEELLDLPLSVFGGTADPFTVHGALELWGRETTGKVMVRHYSGRHFFLLDHARSVISSFVGDIRAALDRAAASPAGGRA